MPGFNRTGPMGMGPVTGRGFGPCGLGLGGRRGFGIGRGMGRFFGGRSVSDYKKFLEEELENIKKEEVINENRP